MERGNLLALHATAWEARFLEDTSLRRLVLEQYDREQVAIRRYLSFLGVKQETVQDVVQECFLKLHEHLLADGDQANLRAWLYRVAHNLARNAQSTFHASRTESVDAGGAEPCAKTDSPEQKFLARERFARLRGAMEELTKAQRECLVLRAEGLKYREIAQVLSLSVSTVGENVQRGIEKLKEMV